MLSAILLCSVAEDCFSAAGGGKLFNPVPLGSTLVILLAVGSNMKKSHGSWRGDHPGAERFLQSAFTNALPHSRRRGAVAASVRQVTTVFFSDLLMSLIHSLLLPLVWVFVALSAADAILPSGRLGGIARRLQKGITWLLSGSLVFVHELSDPVRSFRFISG